MCLLWTADSKTQDICLYAVYSPGARKKKKKLPLAMELKLGDALNQNWASLVVQTVKNLPAMHETWVQSLRWDNPLEKGTATHSSILAWRIPWTEEPGGLQSRGSQRVGHN